jgi:IS30 family transposase
MKDLMTVSEICRVTGKTRAAIYHPIRRGLLKTTTIDEVIHISWKDYISFQQYKKRGRYRKDNNQKPIFNKKEGKWAVGEVCEYMSMQLQKTISKHRVYYMIYSGELACKRYGKAYIIQENDMLQVLDHERERLGNKLKKISSH